MQSLLTSKPRPISNLLIFLSNPWIYFFVFAITNAILAYGSLGLVTNLYIALIGWVSPLMVGLVWFSKKQFESQLFQEEIFPTIPLLWWFLGAVLASLPRLYLLLNPNWPVPDEGVYGSIVLELGKKWDWHFLFTTGQVPPLAFWFGTIYSKCFGSSIFFIRFFSFLLSIVMLLGRYWCGRHFFSKSIMFLCFIFSCFSFGQLYISKFFDSEQFFVVFEIATLGTLGIFLNSNNPKSFSLNSRLLGFVIGLGFWVSIQWPLVAFMILVAVSYKLKKKILNCYKIWIPFFLFFSCFCYFSFTEKYGEHIKMLLSSPLHGDILNRLNDSFSNWTALFWGCDIQNSYGPVWGGMLNPISGSLFFIGIFELVRHRKNHLFKWVLVSFFVFMIPGLITSHFEIFRNSMTFPLLLLICALGAFSLLERINLNRRGLCILAICLVAAPLDFVHLLKSNHSIPNSNYKQAFNVLDQVQKKFGPGLILLDFEPDTWDRTLAITTYPFNAAQNPNLNPSESRWLAFIENVHYKPFLAQKFEKLTAFDLGLDGYWNQGDLTLFVIPIDSQFRSTSQKWLNINQLFHNINVDVLFNDSGASLPQLYNNLSSAEELMKGDRFLESIYYEKTMFFHRNHMDSTQMLSYLNDGLKKGYPLPHLLVTKGLLLSYMGQKKEAEIALQKAIASPLNQTDASEVLQAVKKYKKISLKRLNGGSF